MEAALSSSRFSSRFDGLAHGLINAIPKSTLAPAAAVLAAGNGGITIAVCFNHILGRRSCCLKVNPQLQRRVSKFFTSHLIPAAQNTNLTDRPLLLHLGRNLTSIDLTG